MQKHWTKVSIFFIAALVLVGCNADNEANDKNDKIAETTNNSAGSDRKEQPGATAMVKDVDDKDLGQVSFIENGSQVTIEAEFEGLEPGYQGFHIHEKGICERDAADGPFTTAGGHYNPSDAKHQEHSGDMPPLYVQEDGTAHYSAKFDRVSLDELKESSLAVIIHANADNFANIPDHYETDGKSGPNEDTLKTGDAGDRIGCGVITSSKN